MSITLLKISTSVSISNQMWACMEILRIDVLYFFVIVVIVDIQNSTNHYAELFSTVFLLNIAFVCAIILWIDARGGGGSCLEYKI